MPKDKSGDVESGIGWYRIAYRLDNADGIATDGVPAIGAIAPNLLELRMAMNERGFPGKPLSVRRSRCSRARMVMVRMAV